MATMWRSITVRSRPILRRGSLLFLGFAVEAAMFCMPGIAQGLGIGGNPGSSSTPPGTSSTSGGAKSATLGSGVGPIALPKDFAELRVEPGDLLSVNVYDTPELSDAYRVDPEGDLALPLCGKVKVQGLTATEAARLLETTLRDGQVLVRPQVNVDVQQYAGQYVTVLGEVSSPGRVAVI